MAVAGFYKRVLPSPPAIEFASDEGKILFAEALEDGTMNGFFRLIGTFQTQAEPAFCGLTSLSVVLNALSIDPGRKWKGPWRWFDESMLDCCEPLEKVKKEGITFGKLKCLAKCAGAAVESFRANQSSLDSFRKLVKKCSSSENRHIMVSYDRRLFKQTGTGHFSPLGGYNQRRDMALILDVARFKYPPHWVPIALLWEAINTMDQETGKFRGFMEIGKRVNPPSLLFTLSCRDDRWRATSAYLLKEVPNLLRTKDLSTAEQIVHTVIDSLPANVASFVKWIVEVKLVDTPMENLSKEEIERLECKRNVLQQLRSTRAYALVAKCMSSMCPAGSLETENLPHVVMQACCQGLASFCGARCLSEVTCTKDFAKIHVGSGASGGAALLSSNVSINGGEQTIDALVPTVSETAERSCQCTEPEQDTLHPSCKDLLTVLLLALPKSIWEDIPNSDLRWDICNHFSIDKHQNILQEEVAHLSDQITVVCTDAEED